MIQAIRVLLLAAAFAFFLYIAGWTTVPLVAAVYGLAVRRRAAPREAMTGAMLASLGLLLPQMLSPAFTLLLGQLGAIFPLPGIAVLGLTVLLYMILAFSSARVATGIVGTRDGARTAPAGGEHNRGRI